MDLTECLEIALTVFVAEVYRYGIHCIETKALVAKTFQNSAKHQYFPIKTLLLQSPNTLFPNAQISLGSACEGVLRVGDRLVTINGVDAR